MKETELKRKITREDRKYRVVKLWAYLRMKVSFGKKRKKREITYSAFKQEKFLKEFENGLPEAKYFKPTDLILYDLVAKEDLTKVKRGLIKLYKRHYSHKFLAGGRSAEDIDDIISRLDQTVHSGDSWYTIGLFDFANDNCLDSTISYFAVRFHNFCSSYAAVEMRVKIADTLTEEIAGFINKPYEKPGMSVHRFWGRNKGKTGGKIHYGVSSGISSEYAKAQLVYEQLQYVKQAFLKEIVRFIPLSLFLKGHNLRGINVFETNITYLDSLESSVYDGLGLNERYGFNLSKAERLYINVSAINIWDAYKTDMLYVFNPDFIEDYSCYGTAQNKAIEQLTMEHMEVLYKIVILKDIGIRYWELISKYRNDVNKFKSNRRQHQKLLKAKYLLHREFYEFKKIDEELPVNDESLSKLELVLETNEYARRSIFLGSYHPYKAFVGDCKWRWMQIRNNYIEVENDLNRKIEIADALARFTGDKNNRKMTFFQVVLATMTFIMIIFPDIAVKIAASLKYLWRLVF